MQYKPFLFISFFTALSMQVHAQDEVLPTTMNLYCKPGVIGLPRSKGVVIDYELIPHFNINSNSKTSLYKNANAGISRNGRLDIKLKFPIINRPGITVVGGLRYFQEQMHFTNPSENNYPVYLSLEDRSLKTVGGQFYVIKPTKKNTYFLLRTTFDFNGDFTQSDIPKKDMLKITVAPMFGWKRNENLTYAFGVGYGYLFGWATIYPIISYNKNITCNLGIESLLPSFIRLRYSKNDKLFWYFTTKLSGASYRLSNKIPGLENTDQPHLHRSELKVGLTLEKEIHNWFWFGAEVGFRQSLNFNLTNSARRNRNVLIKNKLTGAPYLGLSLFMVTPRKWIKATKNN